MNLRAVLFFIGILVLIMGGIPFAAETIPAAKDLMNGLPAPGTIIYQGILTILGVIALSYSIRSGNKGISKNDFMKAFGGK